MRTAGDSGLSVVWVGAERFILIAVCRCTSLQLQSGATARGVQGRAARLGRG